MFSTEKHSQIDFLIPDGLGSFRCLNIAFIIRYNFLNINFYLHFSPWFSPPQEQLHFDPMALIHLWLHLILGFVLIALITSASILLPHFGHLDFGRFPFDSINRPPKSSFILSYRWAILHLRHV